MKALDTSLLVRLITNDDPKQAKKVAQLIDAGQACFVPSTVMLELEWVLRGAYKLDTESIFVCFENLLSIKNLTIENSNSLVIALKNYRAGLDFADAVHHSAAMHCEEFLSFDKKFLQRANDAKLEPAVVAP